MAERERQVAVEHPRCPYCRDAVAPGARKTACDACMAWHHTDCWSEHGACSACGAVQALGRTDHAHERGLRPADEGQRPSWSLGDWFVSAVALLITGLLDAILVLVAWKTLPLGLAIVVVALALGLSAVVLWRLLGRG